MVCPSFWAWREARANKFKSAIDLMLCLFPFEPELLKDKGVEAAFIGHPLAEEIKMDSSHRSSSDIESVNIALLPGSRRKEIDFHLEVILDAAVMIRDQLSITKKEVIFFIPTRFKEMEDWIKSFKKFNDLKIKIFKETSDCLSDSDLIITKSGTSTLESALYKKKTIVVYKMSAVSFFLLTKLNLINVNYASLPNILLGNECFKEFIQDDSFINSRYSNPHAGIEYKQKFSDLLTLLKSFCAENPVVKIRLVEFLLPVRYLGFPGIISVSDFEIIDSPALCSLR